MIDGITNSTRSLAFYRRLMEVTANNVAQSNTDGYKAVRTTAHALEVNRPEPLSWTDWSQGPLHRTGRNLDLALQGPGFLVVQTPGGERLVRGGSFALDGDGNLLDPDGNPLLGEAGIINVYGGASIEVLEDGGVVVDGEHAGQLRIEAVLDPDSLEREEAGRFRPTRGDARVVDESSQLRQGWLEESNVDPMLSLVDLININRAYQANLKALKTLDGALGIAATQIGDTP